MIYRQIHLLYICKKYSYCAAYFLRITNGKNLNNEKILFSTPRACEIQACMDVCWVWIYGYWVGWGVGMWKLLNYFFFSRFFFRFVQYFLTYSHHHQLHVWIYLSTAIAIHILIQLLFSILWNLIFFILFHFTSVFCAAFVSVAAAK